MAADPWRPLEDSGLGAAVRSIALGVLLCLPVLGLAAWKTTREIAAREAARLAFVERLGAHDRLVAGPAREMFPVDTLVKGRSLFATACAACHKPDGTGIDGLGRDLTQSWFVASNDDAELRAFIEKGRPVTDPLNFTRVPMPPKGGHEDLTDADLADIIAFVRAIQDPRRMPELPAPVAAAPPVVTQDDVAAAMAAAGGDAELAGYIANGTKLFNSLCISCHGKAGVGIPGNGKPLVKNPFVQSLDDDGLLAFVKQGRGPSDPKNTTGIQMPPKGGNPALSDDDILDIISYLRTLQGDKPAAASGK
jgi:disulfide bond formation protein DsbB